MLYEKPILDVLKFEVKDVIRTSYDDGTGDNETPAKGDWAS